MNSEPHAGVGPNLQPHAGHIGPDNDLSMFYGGVLWCFPDQQGVLVFYVFTRRKEYVAGGDEVLCRCLYAGELCAIVASSDQYFVDNGASGSVATMTSDDQ